MKKYFELYNEELGCLTLHRYTDLGAAAARSCGMCRRHHVCEIEADDSGNTIKVRHCTDAEEHEAWEVYNKKRTAWFANHKMRLLDYCKKNGINLAKEKVQLGNDEIEVYTWDINQEGCDKICEFFSAMNAYVVTWKNSEDKITRIAGRIDYAKVIDVIYHN